jgi:hypothetical protein
VANVLGWTATARSPALESEVGVPVAESTLPDEPRPVSTAPVDEPVPAPRCGRCGRPVPPGYRLQGGDLRCWRHVLPHPAVWKRSLITALIVGTILTAINQGNFIVHSGFSHQILLKMALTSCVPFCVSTSGALGAARIRRPR